MRFAPAVISRCVDLLAPVGCLGCGVRVAAERAPLLLCARCRGRLRPVDSRRHCRRCLRPLAGRPASPPLCLGCAVEPPALDRLLAAWWYEPPLDGVIRAFKFGRLEPLATPLVDAALGRELGATLDDVECVVPVPLALWRRWSRGFNQAERLAAALARRLDRPLVEALARPGLRPRRQASLHRSERARILVRGMRVRLAASAAVAGRSVLLVDDVVTTGATLAAAAQALRRAGVREITGCALAATPARRPRGPS